MSTATRIYNFLNRQQKIYEKKAKKIKTYKQGSRLMDELRDLKEIVDDFADRFGDLADDIETADEE